MRGANATHANPYSCAGSRKFTRQSWRLWRFLKMLKIPYACTGFPRFTRQSLRLWRFPTMLKISWPVQDPKNSHANSYACAGSQQLTCQSLRLCRLPTTHMPILMPVQAPDKSHTNPYACEGSRQFKQFNTWVRLIACDHRKGHFSQIWSGLLTCGKLPLFYS